MTCGIRVVQPPSRQLSDTQDTFCTLIPCMYVFPSIRMAKSRIAWISQRRHDYCLVHSRAFPPWVWCNVNVSHDTGQHGGAPCCLLGMSRTRTQGLHVDGKCGIRAAKHILMGCLSSDSFPTTDGTLRARSIHPHYFARSIQPLLRQLKGAFKGPVDRFFRHRTCVCNPHPAMLASTE